MAKQPNQPTSSSSQLDVHTMPQRFVSSQADGKKAKLIGLVIIISVVTVILIVAVFFINSYFKKSNGQPTSDNQKVAVSETEEKAEPKETTSKKVTVKQEEPEEKEEEEEEMEEEIEGSDNKPSFTVLPSSSDFDKDNLTDIEEELYGTDENKPDSDEDSYLDGSELLSGYNPNGAGSLAASGLIDTFTDSLYDYSVVYPINWTLEVTSAASQEIMLVTETGEFIQIFVQDNPQNLTALDWYLKQWPGLRSNQVKKIEVDGLDGVWSSEGLTVYLVNGNQLYVINYSVGNKEEINFKTTFEMIVNSFKLVD